MNFLIWGTGSSAELFLNEYWDYFFVKNSILRFIDNDDTKTGWRFFDKNIISPSMVHDFLFDKIIICSSYEKEIKEQLITELKISESDIMTQENVYEELYHFLIEEQKILQKKILIIGDTDYYHQLQNDYSKLFHISGFVDIRHIDMVKNYSYDYILLMNLMNISYLNTKIGKINLEKYWINEISKTCNIDNNKILTSSLNQLLISIDRRTSWGNENSDKTFLIIQGGALTGLGAYASLVAINVFYAQQKGYIPVVDMMTYKNQYLEVDELGKVNAWEKFFEQPAGYGMEDIQNSKNIILSANKRNYNHNTNNIFSFLKMKSKLQREVEKYTNILFKNDKKVLGVLFRGSDYANKKPYGHEIQPNLQMMILKVKEKILEWGIFDTIYLCTEIEEAVIAFKKEFQEKLYCYPQQRVHANYNKYLAENTYNRENDAYYRGADYWVVLELLSQCHSLIGGNCSGTRIAMELNNNHYEHTYIFYLGKYGLNNS